MYSNHATVVMFSREPYQMVTDQILDEFCILKFKKFECITVDNMHKGIIVSELEILYQGSEVNACFISIS